MTENEFEEYAHTAVHDAMELNEHCKDQWGLGTWASWDYDLDEATLTFSDPDGRAPLELNIQVVGTTSNETGTWLWGWGNEHLPAVSTDALQAVREFGRKEELHLLTTAKLPDDEFLGWKLTAIAARLLNATGRLAVDRLRDSWQVDRDRRAADSRAAMPDAWCEACDKKWELEEGDPDRPPITVICHHCYESARTKARAGWLF